MVGSPSLMRWNQVSCDDSATSRGKHGGQGESPRGECAHPGSTVPARGALPAPPVLTPNESRRGFESARSETAGGLARRFLGSDSEDVPMGRRPHQVRAPVGRLGLRHFSQDGGAPQDPVALDQCQIRGDDGVRAREDLSHVGTGDFVQEPRQNGTGLGIDAHRDPRSSSRSSDAVSFRRRRRGKRGYSARSPGAPSVASPRLARTASAAGTSASSPRCPGGASSATTSPRSVTKTRSPARTSLRYSLRRFFSSRTPTLFTLPT